MTDQPTIAELSRQVAEKKGWTLFESTETKWMMRDGTMTNVFWKDPATDDFAYPPDYTEPARLWELEGECQRAGWTFGYWLSAKVWSASPLNLANPELREPATPEGRVRIVLRAWLEMSDTLPA